MKKGKIAEILNAIGFVVGLLITVCSLFSLGSIFLEYHKGSAEYGALQRMVFTDTDGQSDTIAEKQVEAVSDQGTEEDAFAPEAWKVQQALGKLREENEDTVGWIAFDHLDISYPIMQCEDNVYYLNHTFSGEENSAGSIFMEAENTSDFQDCHTIVYGHNMKNLSMFGRLKKYKTEDFYQGNEYFTIYTESAVYRYQIFAFYDIPEDGDVYTIGFEADDTFQTFVDAMKKRSYYDTGVSVTKEDKVITLSTCSTEGNRFVVHGKRVEVIE